MRRIYVASLADYNAGKLVGTWLDCEDYEDGDALTAAVTEYMKEHAEPGADEFAIHDSEGFPKGLIGEFTSFDAVMGWHDALDGEGEAFEAFVADDPHYISSDGPEAALDRFNGAYIGEGSSPEDFAYSYVEDTGMLQGVPEHIQVYFDYEAFACDLGRSGVNFVKYNGTCYAFSRNV